MGMTMQRWYIRIFGTEISVRIFYVSTAFNAHLKAVEIFAEGEPFDNSILISQSRSRNCKHISIFSPENR